MKILTVEETQAVLTQSGINDPLSANVAITESTEALLYAWHDHPYHQILFARKGTTQVEGPDGRYLLPAGHALWIPARTRHRTMIRDLEGLSLFLEPATMASCSPSIRAFPVSAVMEEMMFHALRWPDGAQHPGPLAQSFFQTLTLLCQDAIQGEGSSDFILPRATHPALVRAMDAALMDPGRASLGGTLKEAGMSERSFRRHFGRETGMSWQQWITQARLFHAATLLARGQRVTDVAAETGYASLSAFAQAFSRLLGTSPGVFRNRSQ